MIYLILLPVYIALNIYFVYEIYKWIDALFALIKCEKKRIKKAIKAVLTVLYGICAFSLLIAFSIPDEAADSLIWLTTVRRIFKLIGNYHEGIIVYMMMFFAVIWIARLVERAVCRAKDKPIPVSNLRRTVVGLIGIVFILSISWRGTIAAQTINDTKYDITVSKSVKSPEMHDKLRIALIADVHLGYNVGCDRVTDMVNKINENNPDIVLIAGDIFDNEYAALENPDKLIELFKSIETKYGVYAVLGNHDIEEPILGGFTFGGDKEKCISEQMLGFLDKANIRLLHDEGVMIEDSVYLYGRPDYERLNLGSTSRKSPEEITAQIDDTVPIIVLDHEPRELELLSDAGVDLDLCGHTHDGQIFPLNLTSRWFSWENSTGLIKIGDMYNIVTSGVGLFGPNLRVGTDAEICIVDVNFPENND